MGGLVAGEKAAKPATAVRDCVSTFVGDLGTISRHVCTLKCRVGARRQLAYLSINTGGQGNN